MSTSFEFHDKIELPSIQGARMLPILQEKGFDDSKIECDDVNSYEDTLFPKQNKIKSFEYEFNETLVSPKTDQNQTFNNNIPKQLQKNIIKSVNVIQKNPNLFRFIIGGIISAGLIIIILLIIKSS